MEEEKKEFCLFVCGSTGFQIFNIKNKRFDRALLGINFTYNGICIDILFINIMII